MRRRTIARHSAIFAALLGLLPLSGCLVAGYTSNSGFWVWPGSIVITLVLILFYFLTRRH